METQLDTHQMEPKGAMDLWMEIQRLHLALEKLKAEASAAVKADYGADGPASKSSISNDTATWKDQDVGDRSEDMTSRDSLSTSFSMSPFSGLISRNGSISSLDSAPLTPAFLHSRRPSGKTLSLLPLQKITESAPPFILDTPVSSSEEHLPCGKETEVVFSENLM